MKIVARLAAVLLFVVAPFALAHTATYYNEYTNASTQLALALSPATATYWDGSSVNLNVTGYGYNCPNGSGPGATLLINCEVDGVEVATTSLLWGCYYPNQATAPVPLLGLPVGTHTVTVRYTNSVEYYTQTMYSSTYTHSSWGTTYYHTYYNRIHYLTVPCSASQTLTVKPSPNFRKLLISQDGNTVYCTYTGIPTNNYGFYMSPDLVNWYLLSVRKTSTNGQVQFGDNLTAGAPWFYRVYGP